VARRKILDFYGNLEGRFGGRRFRLVHWVPLRPLKPSHLFHSRARAGLGPVCRCFRVDAPSASATAIDHNDAVVERRLRDAAIGGEGVGKAVLPVIPFTIPWA